MFNNGLYVLLPHPKFGLLLLAVLVMMLVLFVAARFRLNKFTGLLLVIIYLVFLAYAFTQELACMQGVYC